MLTVVRKPWGYEYPIFESERVGLWFLCIKSGQSTSLHCHPKKKTGLVVLEGAIDVSFLNDSLRLGPTDRVMIRPGLFHRSSECSGSDAFLLEIESPRDKEDLVRFADDYGRESMPYEDGTHLVSLAQDSRAIPPLEEWATNTFAFGGILFLWIKPSDLKELGTYDKKTTVLVLAGSLGEDSHEVLGAGDVVTIGTLEKLGDRFLVTEPLSLLLVRPSL
jgi:mannose-6-phosphate isomerase-like protein (cupin superfamily)